MSSAVERFVRSASEMGIAVRVERFPEGTRTAADAASAIGCAVDQIVKSLVFMADGRPVPGRPQRELFRDTWLSVMPFRDYDLEPGGRPDAVREASPSTPSRIKVERQSRTTSSRTLKAAPMCALVQPSSVNKIARARSASARSRDAANSASASLCSCDATTGDRPAMTPSIATNQLRLHPLAEFGNPA